MNIPSMTEEQREHFAQQFDVAYNYAFHVLQKHPTPELANLCFDNITFKTGLLLRSNLSIRHSIENMGDPEILKSTMSWVIYGRTCLIRRFQERNCLIKEMRYRRKLMILRRNWR